MAARIGVIGASGQIGCEVLDVLRESEVDYVAICRSADGLGGGRRCEVRQLRDYSAEELTRCLQGCTDAIVTLGLPYRAKVWLAEWPSLVRSVLSAASARRIPLTFLDNMYVYGKARGPLSETSPLQPCARKGVARRSGLAEIQRAREDGCDVVVCRAADFLGPGAETTVVPWSAVKAACAGRSASIRWFGDADAPHSFACPAEVAAGLVAVCTGGGIRRHDVVHMPALRPLSGNDLAASVSRVSGRKVRLMPVGSAMLSIAGLVSPAAREQREMMYEFDQAYVVDDSLFRSAFPDFPVRSVDDLLEGAGAVPR